MDALLRQFSRLNLRTIYNMSPLTVCLPAVSSGVVLGKPMLIHTSSALNYEKPTGPQKWPFYNRKIFPPTKATEEKRPAFICHHRANVKYSPWKMWYVASMIRGMTVDEAIKQLTFVKKKGATIVKEVLLEAQKLAVEQHHVEYKSNLWVAESFSTKGKVIKGIRRHAKSRIGVIKYIHCHYFVRLEEGSPPKHYYLDRVPKTTQEHLAEWVNEMRQRRIPGSI